MGEENKVILHGMWASPFAKKVELALKLKGVPFEYVEEDFSNKSPELLQHNPVHKKVPVLVHNGKPIAESQIILEYIDETWKNSPQFLPQDPYKRAKVRFWASFIPQLFMAMIAVIRSDGEAQEKAIKEVFEKSELLEEGMKEFFPDGKPCIDSKNMGFLDIVYFSMIGLHNVLEEVSGKQFTDPEKTPFLCSWLNAIKQVPLVKDLTPPHDELFEFVSTVVAPQRPSN